MTLRNLAVQMLPKVRFPKLEIAKLVSVPVLLFCPPIDHKQERERKKERLRETCPREAEREKEKGREKESDQEDQEGRRAEAEGHQILSSKLLASHRLSRSSTPDPMMADC